MIGQKKNFPTLWLLIAFGAFSIPSLAQSGIDDRGDATALAIMEGVRSDLLTSLDTKDREVIQKVVFYAPLSAVGIGGVKAYLDPTSGEPRINMNTGAHYSLLQIAQAFLIANKVLKQNKDNFLLGYIRYLSYWSTFKDKPMTAAMFAEYYGNKDIQSSIDKLDPIIRAIADGVYRILNTFVVAHELAHHVKKDVEKPVALPDEQQERESIADKWASDHMQDIGVPPDLAVLSMLVINELENGTLKGELVRDHPAALRRSLAILDNSISRLKERRPQIESAFRKSSATIDFDKYVSELNEIKSLTQGKLDYQLRLDKEPEFIIDKAKHGDWQAQMRLAEAYIKGNYKGIPHDDKKAIFWSKVVALREDHYHYFDNVFSKYMVGTLISPSDQEQGCFFVALAQKKGLIVADCQMRFFQEKLGACKNYPPSSC